MNSDKNIKEIQSDIRAIKMQLEALMCESRLRRLDTLSVLLEMAYKEASEHPDSATGQTHDLDIPTTVQ